MIRKSGSVRGAVEQSLRLLDWPAEGDEGHLHRGDLTLIQRCAHLLPEGEGTAAGIGRDVRPYVGNATFAIVCDGM